MSRVVHIGDATLILGDCREVIPTLGNVDSVVTDPPYEIAAQGGGIGAKRKYLADITDHIDSGFDVDLLGQFDNWLVFCGKPQILRLATRAEESGLRWQLLTWNKTNPTPLTNGNYLPDTEYMVHAFRRHDWESKTRFVVGQVERTDIDHPTVKPLYVMRKALLSASACGETVLDPYMGSGTTGVACVNLGRKFIGIEIHEPYFEIACRRIEASYRQPRLFAEPPPKPKQEVMPL